MIVAVAAEMATVRLTDKPTFRVKILLLPAGYTPGSQVWVMSGAQGLSDMEVLVIFMCILSIFVYDIVHVVLFVYIHVGQPVM